jgi:predicted metal-dependent hydrolase
MLMAGAGRAIKVRASTAIRKRITDPAQDDVEKFLAEQKAIEAKRHELIKEILREKEAAVKAFDEKLARLGHHGDGSSKRSHHKNDADKNAPAAVSPVPRGSKS